MIDGYYISTKTEQMDLAVIHDFLFQSYWAKGIPLETLRRAIENSLCFGVFTTGGDQVGFARMITDQATYAYLADVFVIPGHRSRGIAKWLLETILDHPQLQGLRRITLCTQDAHELYERFGFKALAQPRIFMEQWTPEIYLKR